MEKEKKIALSEALHHGLQIATGCTEPAALAYAGALAHSLCEGEIQHIEIAASSNVIKNAFVVGIPGTDAKGIAQAVALGVAINAPENKLNIFGVMKEADVLEGKRFVESGIVNLTCADTESKLYILVSIKTEKDEACVEIKDTHTHISRIIQNGKEIFTDSQSENQEDGHECLTFTLADIFEYCKTCDCSELDLVKRAMEFNWAVAEEGMRNPYGLQVGRTIKKNIELKRIGDDLVSYAMMMAAAGSDARMAGSPMTVMTNSGSGNQGITATVPVMAIYKKLGLKDEELLLRACTLSNLITIYIKSKFGVLSALCGAVIASTGSSCGMVWLLGGQFEQMEIAIHNVLGNVTGMVCDGAKSSCALKISSCTSAAFQAAILAMDNLRIQKEEGIVENLSEFTIDNFATLGNQCSSRIDQVVLDMITHKKAC